ncbi:hypothetical protein CA13_26180 [Planctomycetes bacterium CA13]|uniref:Methanolan biosynthesis EpsI domain-containing protein n=1 Tax=Novipirellula herctigrandis TaxID=2527986 RepID=A0A5C5Z1W9_9BACT|nr:hypothetical protein CA13_26180 [Planctomycetes bacterium CA13]
MSEQKKTPDQLRSPIIGRVPFAAVIVLTLLSGIVHGYLDGRWSKSENLIQQGARLNELPDRCGDWTLAEKQQLDSGALSLLRCYGSEVRVYQHDKSEAKVTVAVMFGPRGPIAVHTPEVCYSSVGTEQVGQRQIEGITTESDAHQLWSVQFSVDNSPEPALDVWYGWSNGGAFQASEYPRFWMTENLYKIQIASPTNETIAQSSGDGSLRFCRDFLQAFLPQLETIVE